MRIGVSAAKGLCFGLDLPLISVPTLQLLAYKVNVSKGRIVSALDARRMEVYSALFDSRHNTLEPTSVKILDANSYAGILQNHQVYFVGNAMDKIKTVITHPNAYFDHQLPSAAEMCGLSYQKFEAKDFEDLAYFEPFYLNDFIATPTIKN